MNVKSLISVVISILILVSIGLAVLNYRRALELDHLLKLERKRAEIIDQLERSRRAEEISDANRAADEWAKSNKN